jgi:plastocyanin
MKMNKGLLIGFLVVVLAAVLSACSASTITTDKNTVNIQGSQFSPVEITIKQGESVTWVNKDSVSHTIVGVTFQSDLLNTGQSFKQIFNVVGTFEYHCSVHPSMIGKVIVVSNGGY